MNKISRRSRSEERVRLGNLRIASLPLVDDVALLASSVCDLQHVLEQIAAECEATRMSLRPWWIVGGGLLRSCWG